MNDVDAIAAKPAKPNRHGIPDMEGMEGMM